MPAEGFDKPASHPERIGEYPRRPLVALKAFRKLANDKEDTYQVFEIIRALSGHALSDQYRRFLRTAEGGRQAYLRPELADRFADKAWLDGFEEGTVGAQYRKFIRLRDLSAYGLADESRKLGEADIDSAHPIAWYARRIRDIHDVWHVLTGYGTDALGEACVISFTYPQTRNLAVGFLSVAAGLELKRSYWKAPYLRALYQAWRHGRKAAWLPAQDYEKLFAEPLESARARLNIARPTVYESVPLEARNAYEYPAEETLTGYWPQKAA